jgi:hypothetical protein
MQTSQIISTVLSEMKVYGVSFVLRDLCSVHTLILELWNYIFDVGNNYVVHLVIMYE